MAFRPRYAFCCSVPPAQLKTAIERIPPVDASKQAIHDQRFRKCLQVPTLHPSDVTFFMRVKLVAFVSLLARAWPALWHLALRLSARVFEQARQLRRISILASSPSFQAIYR